MPLSTAWFFALLICFPLWSFSQERDTFYFGFDRSNVNLAQTIKLKALLEGKASTISHVKITGHADLQGDADYNLMLSKRRAEAIAFALTKLGFTEDQLKISWEGEAQPVAGNASIAERKLNRRVELEWESSPSLRTKLLKAIQDGDPDTAIKAATQALENDSEETIMWYFLGYAYKDRFKINPSPKGRESDRDKAIECFEKFYQLTNEEEKAEYEDNLFKLFNYLASTYYNDAAKLLDEEDCYSQCIQKARDFYAEYSRLVTKIDPGKDLKESKIQFLLVVASTYSKWYEATEEDTVSQFLPPAYEEVLKLDPDNLSATYNLGAFYFNKGFALAEAAPSSCFGDSENIQQAIHYFQIAKPYLEKACQMDQERCKYLWLYEKDR